MGSAKQDKMSIGDERPQHTLDLPTYYIGKYPVTNAQYTAFVLDGGYAEPRYWPEAQKAGVWDAGLVKGRYDDESRAVPANFGVPFNLANHPVVGVTWYEMLAYCRWLRDKLQVAGLKSKV